MDQGIAFEPIGLLHTEDHQNRFQKDTDYIFH